MKGREEMIAGEELLLIVNDKSLDENLKERLNEIIEEEIKKPESETDTELIEYCLNELNRLDGACESSAEQSAVCEGDRRKKFKHKKLFTAAAAVFMGVVSLSAVAVGTNLFQHR